jgi:membrane protein DedA with SNARE-associated domain
MGYGPYSYHIIFIILLICGLGVPIPEDITLVVAGVLVSYDVVKFWPILLICMAGVLIGDSTIFLIGRFLGKKTLSSVWFSKMLHVRHVDKAKRFVKKYGSKAVFGARFMPGFRAPIYFSLGFLHKSYLKFLFIDGLAALISVPIWIYVGMFFGNNIPLLDAKVKSFKMGIFVVVGLIIVLIILAAIFKKKITVIVDKATKKS